MDVKQRTVYIVHYQGRPIEIEFTAVAMARDYIAAGMRAGNEREAYSVFAREIVTVTTNTEVK